MTVRVQAENFDIAAELADVRAAEIDGTGGLVTFTGIVRGSENGDAISAMTLEYYPGMTLRELEKIEAEAHERWPLTASRIIHRYGRLEPGENIVLVITASAHRQAAFEASEFLVDWLKTRVAEARATDPDFKARQLELEIARRTRETAETAEQYLSKGSLISIEGRRQARGIPEPSRATAIVQGDFDRRSGDRRVLSRWLEESRHLHPFRRVPERSSSDSTEECGG